MGFMKLILVLGAIYFGYQWWTGHDVLTTFSPRAAVTASPNGFLPVAMPDGAMANTVIILAPLNCPSDAAVRADELSRRLTRMGIKNVRSNSYNARVDNATPEQRDALKRATDVLNGGIPAVFINGMGKANPTAEEVAGEYKRTL